ncbi:Flagellar basal-body rod modification protein FlgD [Candidatus Rhodobacter oscarellae]|uniref:Basal-body rod modification protein FlgD n=1 Tax=Candidatus Rhodobacter oscarellae TaxID=1675527 RepID=A0A0J9H0G0_9RHOB|nr:flagellar hook capping FlgD N-terminal domain-containing protein [Candidatus Rhodobacter lobularis]KMW59223.1 Flagellar basal-body rod modification protein FlgD [Candidatus Rhodobacter lobularis]
MEINPNTTANGASSASSSSGSATSGISSDFETFLRMLTVQLENQDPLEPVKSEDFAVQLATFSGVEQQVLTNDLLQDLAGQMTLTGMAQYAGWVGMEARAPVAAFFSGAPITIAPEPERTADAAVLVVRNEAGDEIDRLAMNVSDDLLQWNGQFDGGAAPTGLYSFEVESYRNDELLSSAPVDVYTMIVEARQQNGQTVLITAGEVEVSVNDIGALREPLQLL